LIQPNEGRSKMSRRKKKIWIDLDNSPHVPFFKPIINELDNRGYSILLTARDCFQVCGLADLNSLKYNKIGRHYGKNKFLKVLGLLIRSGQLVPIVRKEKPDLAISHGSRSQVLLSSILRIPSIVLADYEFTQIVAQPTYIIMPELIPDNSIKNFKGKILKYPGIKEDVYVPFFTPDVTMRDELNVGKDEILITIRPPATEAHYHNPESEILFFAVVNYLGQTSNTRILILPRNEIKQSALIKSSWPQLFKSKKIIIPEHVFDGLNLIYHSDLIISGGGTMNREAAALGVPVYSIFRGQVGAVDQYLSDNGMLTFIENTDDIHSKIILEKRQNNDTETMNKRTLNHILDIIEEILKNPL